LIFSRFRASHQNTTATLSYPPSYFCHILAREGTIFEKGWIVSFFASWRSEVT